MPEPRIDPDRVPGRDPAGNRLRDGRIPLLVLGGPTASGKTSLSLALAGALDGEIVSADSMQVYRGMDIGTAKATPAEQARAAHHLIDICDPQEDFDVARYVPLARGAIREIASRGRLPILVGGTGFYIQAVLKDLDFSEGEPDSALREELREYAETHGAGALHARLWEADPESAAAIHPNNLKRVIRALEYYRETGEKLSDLNRRQQEAPSPYRYFYAVLDMPRAELYRRIDRRVGQMLEAGLREEVARLKAAGCRRGMSSMQALGYKEILDEMDGLCTAAEAEEKIRRESRRYAKRQLTWFRRENAVRFDRSCYDSEQALTEAVLRGWRAFLQGAGQRP